MIYFYRHKRLNEFSQEEIDMLGYEGVSKFAEEHGLQPDKVFAEVKALERQIEQTKTTILDPSSPNVKKLLDKSVSEYIEFFNKNANYQKQAYVVIGNIGSGKTTYADMIEEDTHSIIIDSDRFRTGENTKNGFFEGFSSLYSPEDNQKIQKSCTLASAIASEKISQTGMNIIIPTAPNSEEYLDKKIKALIENNYDIHLIFIDAPYPELANRTYFRYLVKEYEQELDPNGNLMRGRFAPLSIIKSFGDPCFDTFVKTYHKKRFKSYQAFYNDKNTNGNESIDLKTMQH